MISSKPHGQRPPLRLGLRPRHLSPVPGERMGARLDARPLPSRSGGEVASPKGETERGSTTNRLQPVAFRPAKVYGRKSKTIWTFSGVVSRTAIPDFFVYGEPSRGLHLVGVTGTNGKTSVSQLVAQAGSTMDEVVSSVRRVTDIVGEISSASQEQSAGITEVGNAVTLMDEATQQNAALVEEAAAAATSLRDQADQLNSLVRVFKV